MGGAIFAIVFVVFVIVGACFLFKLRTDIENRKRRRQHKKEWVDRRFLQLKRQLENLLALFAAQNPEASDFFARYIKEKIEPYATMIVSDTTSYNVWDFFNRQFLLVPDYENKRVYMIFHIFYCRKDSDGLFENLDWPNDDQLTTRRALNENEKKALLSASVFDYRQYSDCHVCHTGNCLGYHDEHTPCHSHQPCEATCNTDGAHYFDSYDEKELQEELAKETLDLSLGDQAFEELDRDLGGGD